MQALSAATVSARCSSARPSIRRGLPVTHHTIDTRMNDTPRHIHGTRHLMQLHIFIFIHTHTRAHTHTNCHIPSYTPYRDVSGRTPPLCSMSSLALPLLTVPLPPPLPPFPSPSPSSLLRGWLWLLLRGKLPCRISNLSSCEAPAQAHTIIHSHSISHSQPTVSENTQLISTII
jgi:hypothetical protein